MSSFSSIPRTFLYTYIKAMSDDSTSTMGIRKMRGGKKVKTGKQLERVLSICCQFALSAEKEGN